MPLKLRLLWTPRGRVERLGGKSVFDVYILCLISNRPLHGIPILIKVYYVTG